MPSRKQRRRREKSLRHEYETVILEADGTEHAIDRDELRSQREAKVQARAKPAKGAAARRRGPARTAKEVAPPSWERALRRGGLMGGLMLVVFIFLFKSAPITQRVTLGAFYAIAFIPLTYFVDRTAYRSYQRRLAKTDASKSPEKK